MGVGHDAIAQFIWPASSFLFSFFLPSNKWHILKCDKP